MKAITLALFLLPFTLAQQCLPAPGGYVQCYTFGRSGTTYCQSGSHASISQSQYLADSDFALSSVVQGPGRVSISGSPTFQAVWLTQPSNLPCYHLGTYEGAIGSALNVDLNQVFPVYNNGSTYSIPYGQYGVLVINVWTQQSTGSATTYWIIPGTTGCNATGYCSGFDIPSAVDWGINVRLPDPSLGPGTHIGGTISLLTSPSLPIPCKVGSCSHSM